MAPPEIAARLDHMQVMRPRLAFAEEMPPRKTLLPSILVTDAFERHYALPGIRNLPHGDGNINDGLSPKPADRCASDVLDGERVLTDGDAQPFLFFGKQVMPPLSVRHESHDASF